MKSFCFSVEGNRGVPFPTGCWLSGTIYISDFLMFSYFRPLWGTVPAALLPAAGFNECTNDMR